MSEFYERRPVMAEDVDLTENETAEQQIDRLAQVIMDEVPGEPSENQGAVDTAIRIIRATPDIVARAVAAESALAQVRRANDDLNSAYENWLRTPGESFKHNPPCLPVDHRRTTNRHRGFWKRGVLSAAERDKDEARALLYEWLRFSANVADNSLHERIPIEKWTESYLAALPVSNATWTCPRCCHSRPRHPRREGRG